MSRLAFVLVALAGGCSLAALDLAGLPCPCVGAYTCDVAQNRCIERVSGPYTLTSAASVRVREATSVGLDVSLSSTIDQSIDVSLALPEGLSAKPGTISLSRAASNGAFVVSASANAALGAATLGLIGTDSAGKTQRIDVSVEVTPRPGSTDTTFGTEGIVTIDAVVRANTPVHIAVRPDDRIVIACAQQGPVAVVQLSAEGVFDGTFGGSGVASIEPGSDQTIYAPGQLLLLPDGKTLVVGTAFMSTAGWAAQLTAEGQLDSSFGSNGVVTLPFGAVAAALRSDGRIVVAGVSADHTALLQLMPDGAIDTSFGTNGQVLTSFSSDPDAPLSLTIVPDGRIAVVGGTAPTPTTTHGIVALFQTTGTLDASYGGTGVVICDLHTYATSVANGPGATLVVGSAITSADSPYVTFVSGALSRYSMAGAPDATFGTNGSIALPDVPRSFASTDYGETAYLTDGSLGELDGSGSVEAAFGPVKAGLYRFGDLARQSGGQLVVVDAPPNTTMQVTRYWP